MQLREWDENIYLENRRRKISMIYDKKSVYVNTQSIRDDIKYRNLLNTILLHHHLEPSMYLYYAIVYDK